MVEFFTSPELFAALLTLTILEIVLGLDNIILISILADKLPQEQQKLARRLGLFAALVTRLMLLSLVFIISHLTQTIFTVLGHEVSWRDILLIVGGLFLLAKGTTEIHEKIEGHDSAGDNVKKHARFGLIILQIAIMDIVFSFDSVITAIGMTHNILIMIVSVVISMIIMVFAIDSISSFINKHPTIKVLALSYMLLIGLALIGEGLEMHIPKGYLYFAMAFSVLVELVNMAIRNKKSASKIKS
ncbi:MAG: TerC family protein [Alphaproteobacteria bacterium]|nr:TerC family protein [Alphaproteobacteria bacterium]